MSPTKGFNKKGFGLLSGSGSIEITAFPPDKSTGNVNPEGAFTFEEQYEPSRLYGSCVLYTTWAETTGVTIQGYARNDDGTLNCDEDINNGGNLTVNGTLTNVVP